MERNLEETDIYEKTKKTKKKKIIKVGGNSNA